MEGDLGGWGCEGDQRMALRLNNRGTEGTEGGNKRGPGSVQCLAWLRSGGVKIGLSGMRRDRHAVAGCCQRGESHHHNNKFNTYIWRGGKGAGMR